MAMMINRQREPKPNIANLFCFRRRQASSQYEVEGANTVVSSIAFFSVWVKGVKTHGSSFFSWILGSIKQYRISTKKTHSIRSAL